MITSLFLSAVLSASDLNTQFPDEVQLHEGQSLLESLNIAEVVDSLKGEYNILLEMDGGVVANPVLDSGNVFIDPENLENLDGECAECEQLPNLYTHEAIIDLNPTVIADPELPDGKVRLERDVQGITFEVKNGASLSELGSSVIPLAILPNGQNTEVGYRVLLYRLNEDIGRMQLHRLDFPSSNVSYNLEPGKYHLIAFIGTPEYSEVPISYSDLLSFYEKGRYQVVVDNSPDVINTKLLFSTYYDVTSLIIPWESSSTGIAAYSENKTSVNGIAKNFLINVPGYTVSLIDNNKQVNIIFEHKYSGYKIRSKDIKLNVDPQGCEIKQTGPVLWVMAEERNSRLVSDVYLERTALVPGLFVEGVINPEDPYSSTELLDFQHSPVFNFKLPLQPGYVMDPLVDGFITTSSQGYEVTGYSDSYIINDGNLSLGLKLAGCDFQEVTFSIEYGSASVPEIILDDSPIMIRMGDMKHLPMSVSDSGRNMAGVYAIAKHKETNMSYLVGSYRLPSAVSDTESSLTHKLKSFTATFGKVQYDIHLPLVPYDPNMSAVVMNAIHPGDYYLDIIAFDSHLNTRHKRLDLVIEASADIDTRPFAFIYMVEGLAWPEDGYYQGEFSLPEGMAGSIKLITMDSIDDGTGEVVLRNPGFIELFKKRTDGQLDKVGHYSRVCAQDSPITLAAGDYVIRSALTAELLSQKGSPGGQSGDGGPTEGMGLLGVTVGDIPSQYLEYYTFENYCPISEVI